MRNQIKDSHVLTIIKEKSEDIFTDFIKTYLSVFIFFKYICTLFFTKKLYTNFCASNSIKTSLYKVYSLSRLLFYKLFQTTWKDRKVLSLSILFYRDTNIGEASTTGVCFKVTKFVDRLPGNIYFTGNIRIIWHWR